jgi:thioredoxin reductase
MRRLIMEKLDCVIIGGGPAGLNATLVLGRSRRNVMVIDEGKPRNRVTRESHGYLTRDGITPGDFRAISRQEITKYPSVIFNESSVIEVVKDENHFKLTTSKNQIVKSKKIIISTGLKEILPNVRNLDMYYGKSLFNCPYCDGWELRDEPLVLIGKGEMVFQMAKLVVNWSKDLLVCTNGEENLMAEQEELLKKHNIKIFKNEIDYIDGNNQGQMESILFKDGSSINRKGVGLLFLHGNIQQISMRYLDVS